MTGPTALLEVCPQQGPPDLHVLRDRPQLELQGEKSCLTFSHVLTKGSVLALTQNPHVCVRYFPKPVGKLT